MGATCEAERYFPGDLKLKPNFLNEFDINYVGMELFFLHLSGLCLFSALRQQLLQSHSC